MRPHPELQFGERLLESLDFGFSRTVFATMELPWELVLPRLPSLPQHVIFVQTMERSELDRIEEELAEFDLVVGVGGGSCMDCAKYLAWKRNSRLILIPSIASVDACVTPQVAVREGRQVCYVGHAQAEGLLVDFRLISAAPPRLNRAGAADILSIHTGSFDWLLGHTNKKEAYDETIARRCAEVVDELERYAGDICDVTDTGIRKLIELFEAENDLCMEFGNSRPEEGSEHFFAYNAERVTGKHFIHGELVCLGILLMSRLQNNKPEWIASLLKRLGVLYRPSDLGLEMEELYTILTTLAEYCRAEGLAYSIVDECELSPATVKTLVSDLEAMD